AAMGDEVLGDGAGGTNGRFGFQLDSEELEADAAELAVDFGGLHLAGGFEQGEGHPRAVDVRQALERAVAGDDAVVVTGGEQRPSVDLLEQAARFGAFE